jgi:hypothetical protein
MTLYEFEGPKNRENHVADLENASLLLCMLPHADAFLKKYGL